MLLPILPLCLSQDLIRPGVRWRSAEAHPVNCHRWVVNNPTFRTLLPKKRPRETRFSVKFTLDDLERPPRAGGGMWTGESVGATFNYRRAKG